MLGLALIPWDSATRAQSSSSVTSGCRLISARRKSSASRSARLTPPAWGKAAQQPVSRRHRHHFSIVERLTANSSAISDCDSRPASRAAMTRSRRSRE
jgi:hypothetical protein